MSPSWFAASMRILLLVEGMDRISSQDVVVHVFQAEYDDGWRSAFSRALELGRSHETEYLNVDGNRVRWRFECVLTLDVLDVTDLDGVEVYSDMTDGEGALDFDTEFTPQAYRPGMTGV